MRALIVDDSALSRMMICKKVKTLVPDVVIVQGVNGQEAVDKYNSFKDTEPFDVIFIDCLMPIKDGLEALEEIRNIDTEIKIIMLTANIQDKVKKRAEDLGCTAFLNKTQDDSKLPSLLGLS
ncbi:MAG: response regulator [Lentisphaeraceae bacterium]|nr:response regulator [Lentisphaeraceae bacterium]